MLTPQEQAASVESHAIAQAAHDSFYETLAAQYRVLFETPEYAYSAARTTPENLARKMTNALAVGDANKDGDGIKRTCKALGIPYTYVGIRRYLSGEAHR